jgi:EAL and modified HD-GYP domain-containing signal transduction protein
LNYLEVETAIKADPALCYRLLRFLNSPTFYLHFEVRSILSALTLLGEQEMRRWLLLVCAATGFRASKAHLFSQMLVRARFGELLGLEAGLPGSSLFILGFLSLMDTILDIPAEAVADMVAISADIRAALKGERNKLRQCLEVMMSFEAAEWSRCEETRRSLRIPDRALSHAYLDAVRWARSFGELV